MRRYLNAVLVVPLIVCVMAGKAAADNGGPWGTASGQGAAAGTSTSASQPAAGAPGSSGGTSGSGPCPAGQTVNYVTESSGGRPVVSGPGDVNPLTGQPVQPGSTIVDIFCNGVNTGSVIVPPGGAIGGGVNPLQLAQQALASAPFQQLVIVVSPPSGREVVNFPIFLSLQGYAPVSATASAGGVTSTVSIVPDTVSWDMGDGHSVSCQGPGVPYDPSRPAAAQLPPPCGYQYSRSSANEPGSVFQVTATVHYTATWTVTGAAGGGNLGPVDRNGSLAVSVGEVQAVNS